MNCNEIVLFTPLLPLQYTSDTLGKNKKHQSSQITFNVYNKNHEVSHKIFAKYQSSKDLNMYSALSRH